MNVAARHHHAHYNEDGVKAISDLAPGEKVAVVKRAGQYIGSQSRRTLARPGARFSATCCFDRRARSIARRIGGAGGRAVAMKPDVTRLALAEAERCLEVSLESFGAVHILVNTAGISSGATGTQFVAVVEITREYWDGDDASIEPGVLNCSRAGLPRFSARVDGRMVNSTSDAGRGGGEPPFSTYAVAGGAVVPVSRALGKEGGRYPTNATCVSPGATPPRATAAARGPQGQEAILRAYPGGSGLGRPGQPADVANAVACLCSDVSRFGVGRPLSVGGGHSMVN